LRFVVVVLCCFYFSLFIGPDVRGEQRERARRGKRMKRLGEAGRGEKRKTGRSREDKALFLDYYKVILTAENISVFTEAEEVNRSDRKRFSESSTFYSDISDTILSLSDIFLSVSESFD